MLLCHVVSFTRQRDREVTPIQQDFQQFDPSLQQRQSPFSDFVYFCKIVFLLKLLQKFKKYTAFETLNSEYCLIKIKDKDHPYNSLLKVLLVEQLGLLHFELKNDFFPGGQTMELKFLYKNRNKIKYFLKISSSAGRREAHNLKS